jgi:hypothetical protein
MAVVAAEEGRLGLRGWRMASVVAAVVALAIPAGAHALRYPTVTWGLSGGTIMDAIETATNPQTGSDGYFFRENVVDFGILDPFVTSWTSSDPYYAGTYYWHVDYHGDYTAGYEYGRQPAMILALRRRAFSSETAPARRDSNGMVGCAGDSARDPDRRWANDVAQLHGHAALGVGFREDDLK